MKSESIRMIEIIAEGLKNKLDDVVFVGGSVLELYIDDVSVSQPRVTDDVDVVFEVATRTGYDKFEEELRTLGFTNDISGPACRMIYKHIKLDIIAADQSAGGFTNKWYEDGFEKHVIVKAGMFDIKIFPVQYFIASKLEAFKDRGKKNLISSHDFEDIIYLFDGSINIEENLRIADEKVREYLKIEMKFILEQENLREAISGHLGFGNTSERADRIVNIFEKLCI